MIVTKIISTGDYLFYVTKEAVYVEQDNGLFAIPCVWNVASNVKYIHKVLNTNVFQLITDTTIHLIDMDEYGWDHREHTKIYINRHVHFMVIQNEENESIGSIFDEYLTEVRSKGFTELVQPILDIMSQSDYMDQYFLDIISRNGTIYLITEEKAYAMGEHGQIYPIDITGDPVVGHYVAENSNETLYIHQGVDGHICSSIERKNRWEDDICYTDYIVHGGETSEEREMKDNVTADMLLASITYVLSNQTSLTRTNTGKTQVIHNGKVYHIDGTYNIRKDTKCVSKIMEFYASVLPRTVQPVFLSESIMNQIFYREYAFIDRMIMPQYGIVSEKCLNEIISHGNGVTNEVMFMLAEEINVKLDRILQGEDIDLPPYKYILLGRAMAGCAIHGNIRLNVHPYFYFLLTGGRYGSFILGYIKDKSIAGLYQMYKRNPTALRELEMGLENHRDFLRYILSGSLSDKQIEIYEHIVSGLLSKIIPSDVFDIFPIRQLVNHMRNYVIDVVWSFLNMGCDKDVYDSCCNKLDHLLHNLSNTERDTLMRNVTGVQQGQHNVTIRICPPRDESAEKDGDSDSEDYPDNSNMSYHISTCMKILTLYVDHNDYDIIFSSLVNGDRLLFD